MKLKYYLRGLGIGIIVTALLMGVSDKKQVTAKNDDYGIEEESSVNTEDSEKIADTSIKESEMNKESEIKEVETQEVATVSATEETKIDEKTTNTINDSEYEVADEETSETIMQTESEELSKEVQDLIQMTKDASATSIYMLEIVRGDDSGTVSRKLQTAGIIENAAEFDAFLMQHGYDKKISIGTVEINKEASWVEIAEKLAGK